MLTLEGAQAGLSWKTILNKREGYRRVFQDFDPAKVAALDDEAIEAAVNDPGIVRHRGKIVSTVGNAQAFLVVQRDYGSFAGFLWTFVGGKPRTSAHAAGAAVPATTPLSDTVSKELRKRGFRFVGSTIVQSFLQACGVLNDHRADCFRAAEIARLPLPEL